MITFGELQVGDLLVNTDSLWTRPRAWLLIGREAGGPSGDSYRYFVLDAPGAGPSFNTSFHHAGDVVNPRLRVIPSR